VTAVRILLALFALLAMLTGASAQGLVFGTSDPTISIHSNFAGETITLFGNIEPSLDGTPPQGTFDVVFVIRGPVEERVVRRKSRQFGIMLNADHALFSGLPSFYRVLSSRPLETILDPEVIAERNLTVQAQAALALEETTGNVALFENELVRLMGEANLYRTDERGICFLSPTFFSTRVILPATCPTAFFLPRRWWCKTARWLPRARSAFLSRSRDLSGLSARPPSTNLCSMASPRCCWRSLPAGWAACCFDAETQPDTRRWRLIG